MPLHPYNCIILSCHVRRLTGLLGDSEELIVFLGEYWFFSCFELSMDLLLLLGAEDLCDSPVDLGCFRWKISGIDLNRFGNVFECFIYRILGW